MNYFDNLSSSKQDELLLNWNSHEEMLPILVTIFLLWNESLLKEPHILKDIVWKIKDKKEKF